ncbi:MAG: hypothetical protein RIS47_2275, partial [Bacteroidota bacterium]
YIFEPKPLTSKFTADNVNMVSCYGTSTGLAQVLASGGNSPYTYRWSHSTAEVSAIATSLFAGSYTVTVVDSKKCEVNASVTITQPSAPLQAEIKPEDVINLKCKADGTGQATVNVWGGTPPYNIDWGDPLYQRGNVLRNVYAGFYAATITDANHCPELTRGVTITEPSSVMVSVDLTSVVQNPCWGDKKGEAKVIATGGTPPYRYLWNDSKSQKTALAVGLPKGYFEALAFDTNNCYAATAVEIRQPINPLNVYFKSYDVKHIQCFGDTDGEASFTLTGGTPPYKYLWNTIPAQTGETAKYLTSGTYTVTITDNNLCQISSPVEIQSPSAALKSKVLPENVSHNLCYGKSTGAVKLTVSGGTTPYSYLWDDPYERIASQIDQLQAGTYHVKITDWNDCVTLDSVTITQPPLIVVTAQKTDILSCYNENIGSIKLSAVGGVPPYQFSINNGLSYPSTDGIFNYLPPSSAYFPRVKDANNCTIRGDFVVINAPPPIQFKDIRFTDVTCMGFNDGTITLLADGGTGTLRYSIDGGLNFLANGGAFLYLKPGTYQLAANDANKCFYNGGELTIKEPLELYLTEQLAIDGCHNANNGIVYTQASGGVGPYSYSLDGVNYQESGRFYDRKPGTYEVLVTDRMGCQTKSYPLKISNPASVAGFTTSIIEGCSPLKVQFKNNVQNMLGYLWSFGDGAGSAEYSPLHTYINRTNNSQIDTVYSYVKSPQGCIDTASTKILVHGMPFVDISAAPKNQTFPNATVSVEDFSDPGFAKYKLIYADGLTNETNQQVGSYTHNYTTWGKYDIHLIVSNDHCWNADTAIVNILPPAAKPSFSPSIGGGCVPYTFVFENSSLYSKSYYWDFGDNTHSTALSPAHTYTQAGVYEVRLQALGMDDLPRTATHTVTVFPLPKPNFVALPDTVYLPRQFVNFENLSHGGVHYTWDFGDGNLSEASDPFHQYRIPGSFTVKLTATSDYGCVDSISKLALITVLSRPLMLFPNAFTPSAFGPTDGSYDPLVSTNNSVFYPLNNAVSHYELRIFNAWGAEIFRTTNVKQGWDGYISGKLAPMGVYVWKAKGTFVNGQLFEDAGDVTLIR